LTPCDRAANLLVRPRQGAGPDDQPTRRRPMFNMLNDLPCAIAPSWTAGFGTWVSAIKRSQR